jgi:hypothetical protein
MSYHGEHDQDHAYLSPALGNSSHSHQQLIVPQECQLKHGKEIVSGPFQPQKNKRRFTQRERERERRSGDRGRRGSCTVCISSSSVSKLKTDWSATGARFPSDAVLSAVLGAESEKNISYMLLFSQHGQIASHSGWSYVLCHAPRGAETVLHGAIFRKMNFFGVFLFCLVQCST